MVQKAISQLKCSSSRESEPLIGGYVSDKRVRWPRTARNTRRRTVTLVVAALIFILCFHLLVVTSVEADLLFRGIRRRPHFRKLTPHVDLPGRVKYSWAQYSPHHTKEKYKDPPEGCKITQAHIVRQSFYNHINPDAHKLLSYSDMAHAIQMMMTLEISEAQLSV